MPGDGDRSRCGEAGGEDDRPLTLETTVSEGELGLITRAAELYDMPVAEFVRCCALAASHAVDHPPEPAEGLLEWVTGSTGPAEA